MIKRSTWIVLAVLVIAVGAYFLSKRHIAASSTLTPTATKSAYLLDLSKNKLQSIRITDDQNHVTLLTRDNTGSWNITLPTPGVADQSQAEAAETQAGALQILTP